MPPGTFIATGIASALVIGLLHALVDSVRPTLLERHRLEPSQGRHWTRLYAIFSIPALILTGWLCDHVGFAEVLFFGSLALGIGVILFTQSRANIFWAILAVAAGGAAVTTAGLALLTVTLRPTQGAGASLNLGFGFIGLAALTTPRFIPWLIRRLGFRQTLVGVALLCLLPAICVIFTPEKDGLNPLERKSVIPLADVLNDMRLWLIVIPTFLYFSLDRSLDVWTKPFLTQLGYGGAAVTRLLIVFWIAFLLTRFVFGWLPAPGFEVWLLLVLLVLSAMVLGNLVGAFAPSSGSMGFWLVAACYGPLLPGFLGVLIEFDPTHPERTVPTVVLGGLFALGYLSDLIIEPGFVAYAKNRPARAAMRIPMILALLMAAPTLVLAVIRHTR